MQVGHWENSDSSLQTNEAFHLAAVYLSRSDAMKCNDRTNDAQAVAGQPGSVRTQITEAFLGSVYTPTGIDGWAVHLNQIRSNLSLSAHRCGAGRWLKLSCMVDTAHKRLFPSEAPSSELECHNSTQGLLLKNNTTFKHVLKTYPSCNYTCFWSEACDFMHTWLLRLFLEHAAVH